MATKIASAASTAPAAEPQMEDAPPGGKQRGGWLARLGIGVPEIIIMLKGTAPIVVAIAMCQANTVAGYFSLYGYFIAMSSFMALPVLPRGKFLNHLLLCVLCVCCGAAFSLLAMWTALQARFHTQSPETANTVLPTYPHALYNASQNAVSGVWLFFDMWLINTLRAKFPSLSLPSVQFSILVDVACTIGSSYSKMDQAETMVKELMEAMLVGLALATASNLLLVPISSRMIVNGQMKNLIGIFCDTLDRQTTYFRSADAPGTDSRRLAGALKESNNVLLKLGGALRTETHLAKRDVAFGKLDGDDIGQISKLLRKIIIPTNGMNTIIDLMENDNESRHWILDDRSGDGADTKERQKMVLNAVKNRIQEPYDRFSEVVKDGFQHAGQALEILSKPKFAKKRGGADVENGIESKGQGVRPGESKFLESLRNNIKALETRRTQVLRSWASEHGLGEDSGQGSTKRRPVTVQDLSEFYILLFMVKMMGCIMERILDLVAFADSKTGSGVMSRSRFILPTSHRFRKMIKRVFLKENAAIDIAPGMFADESSSGMKDPEHLPSHNIWQRFGNAVRMVPRILGSDESTLGFRVACAMMTIGIISYLESSQAFYQDQRLIWAGTLVAFSMAISSGESIFGFLLRLAGTLVGIVLCYIIWYIVDKKVPGIIVFFGLFTYITFYFLYKFPRYIMFGALSQVTVILVIGYELQVEKIGKKTASLTGQPYYPLYTLAPYRLAVVAGGLFVALFWTVFPSPISTDRAGLRREISATMYLLAKYYGAVQETMKTKLRDPDDTESSAASRQLESLRAHLFGELSVLIPAIESHLQFQKWEPTIGGSFPRAVYEEIFIRLQRIKDYLALTAFVLEPRKPILKDEAASEEGTSTERVWLRQLAAATSERGRNEHMVISALALLSNSVRSGQSLPPFLPLPEPLALTRYVMRSFSERPNAAMQLDMLDLRNAEQAGYQEFAVIQICTTQLRNDLDGLVRAVGGLVGVLDFSVDDGETGRGYMSDTSAAEGTGSL